MGEEQTSRGYTLFLSESGCEVHGASRGIRMGEKVLVKIMTDANAPAMVAKAHVIERSRGRVFLAFDNLTPEAFDAFAR